MKREMKEILNIKFIIKLAILSILVFGGMLLLTRLYGSR